jgi:hypothetical protein
VIWTGGSPDMQKRKQKGFLLQDDFTFTGLAGHTLKTGAKVKLMEYDLSGTARSVDIVKKLIEQHDGPAHRRAGHRQPHGRLQFERLPCRGGHAGQVQATTQFGIYVQDDWAQPADSS